jgi:LysM domain
MFRPLRTSPSARVGLLAAATLGTTLFALPLAGSAADLPVTSSQRSTAQQVAQSGVPLSDLAPGAPDSHVVKPGDTLWDISKLFLKAPWRWPELWGMNLDQIRNPHLIYPGQMLLLDKSEGRARLRLAQQLGGDPATVKLSPRIRSGESDGAAITSIPMNLIAPFLNEAVVFNDDELAGAPRIVAAPEGRVLMTRGDPAYVLGEPAAIRDWRVFREAKPLLDPLTREILGYEARYLGTAEYVRAAETRDVGDGKVDIVPATFTLTAVREEVGVGDRMAPAPSSDFASYAPHAPTQKMDGRIISIYGDALTAGQNQIVALNRGSRDNIERGHVLALWRDGVRTVDGTDPKRAPLKLPDERHGMLFVFRVFERVSYALVLTVQQPVLPGDRFSEP